MVALNYVLVGSFSIGVLLCVILMTRVIVMFFKLMKKSEATIKFRSELNFVRSQIRYLKRQKGIKDV